MNKLLNAYRAAPSVINAIKLVRYSYAHPMAACVLSRADADLLAFAGRHAHGATLAVFEPMRNARGEIVEPVFGGSAPYSDESREADRASAGYRKLHGGEGW